MGRLSAPTVLVEHESTKWRSVLRERISHTASMTVAVCTSLKLCLAQASHDTTTSRVLLPYCYDHYHPTTPCNVIAVDVLPSSRPLPCSDCLTRAVCYFVSCLNAMQCNAASSIRYSTLDD